MNPADGAIWENEHGPLGGDELNILLPGRNYGWPLVTFGTDYDGTKISDETRRADLEAPFMYWVPSIAISGLTFYTGDRFPQWKGNVFVGAMFAGRSRGTGHVQRIVINAAGKPINREPLLTELRQRIRDVRQGPDGLLYLLTDEDEGMVLRLEPGPQLAAPNAAGVSMGHLHYAVRDLEANRKFWLALGGTEVREVPRIALQPDWIREPPVVLKFDDVLVVLSRGESAGGTEGSVVNHVAFRVPSLTQVEAAGLKVARLNGFPGVASVTTPEGERIELFENAATNLTFTQDAGFDDAVAKQAQPASGLADRVPPRPPLCARGSGGGRQGLVREGLRWGSRQAVQLRCRRSARYQPELFERSQAGGAHSRAHARPRRVRDPEPHGFL